VADEHRLVEIERFDDGRDVGAERRHRPLTTVRSRLAVPGEVYGHDPVPGGELVYLALPVGPVARPPVHEDQRRPAGAVDLEFDRGSVSRICAHAPPLTT
jgi:hypothetical protein